jgi:uncharacterized protein YpuA (DUF1002 family)
MSVKIKNRTKDVRITLDLPVGIHKQIKTLASQKGETLRQLFIDLASEKIANQNQQSTQKTSKIVRKMPKGVKLGITEEQLNQIISETWLPKF